MTDLKNKQYIVIVQCDIVKQRCPGYRCEKAFNERTGGFAKYSKNKKYRVINLTCGGCCGKAIHRKLSNLTRTIKNNEDIEKNKIVVQLSSCITRDNCHSTPCPHLDYIQTLIGKIGIDICEDTVVSKTSQAHREAGLYNK